MDDNVMKRYASKSIEASHYIQYDQGKARPVSFCNCVSITTKIHWVHLRSGSAASQHQIGYVSIQVSKNMLCPCRRGPLAVYAAAEARMESGVQLSI